MATKTPTEQPATMVKDPELRAMSGLAKLFDGLDANQTARVVAWMLARYGGVKWKLTMGGEQVTSRLPDPNDTGAEDSGIDT
jgi:hypothetical protein